MLKTSKKGRPPCYKSKPGKLPNCHGTGIKTGNDRISPPIKAQVHRAVEGMLKNIVLLHTTRASTASRCYT